MEWWAWLIVIFVLWFMVGMTLLIRHALKQNKKLAKQWEDFPLAMKHLREQHDDDKGKWPYT